MAPVAVLSATESPSKLRADQVDAQEQAFKKASQLLQGLNEALEKNEVLLKQVADRRANAEKLLALSEDFYGFRNEQDLALKAIEQCARVEPRAQEAVEGCRARIRALEKELKAYDPTLWEKTAEVRKLARKLAGSPLPTQGIGEPSL